MGYGQSRRWVETERRQLPRGGAEKKSSRQAHGRRRTRRLRLENLEARQLLAAVPELLADVGLAGDLWSREFTAVGDTVYFSDGGADLWKSGGTPATTEKITTITDPDLSDSAGITDFVDAGGVLAFVVFDYGLDPTYTDDHRVQLWKSNGTAGGTVKVADFGLGSTLPTDSGDAQLTVVGSQVFGVVSTPAAGYELFVSDLNAAGPVKDIFPGMGASSAPNSSYPSELLAFNGELYFAANDGQHGTELWVSDGTAGGTQMVKDIVSSPTGVGSSPTGLTAGNGEFFFGVLNPGADSNPSTGADNRVELWKSNGTAGGTVLVYQFAVGTSPPSGLDDDPQLTYIPETGKLFGVVEFQDGAVRSQDLVCWDGTALPPTMHQWNLNPGGDDLVGNLSPSFGLLGFAADDGTHGREPWLTDGNSTNPLGTFMIKDINSGDGSGIDPFEAGVSRFPAIDAIVYFPANDGLHGVELWRSNGSGEDTLMVADIRPGSGSNGPNSSYPYELAVAQNKLFFVALDANLSYNPWVFDPGTVAADIQMQEVVADGATSLAVTYQIDGGEAASFDVGFFVSTDPVLDAGDTQIDTATIGDPADRTVGVHTKIFTIGTGAGEIALPGAGVAETDGEYFILVVADPGDLIAEADADPIQEDNTASLVGVYHPPGGDVFVHGTQDADQIAVSSGSLQLVVNGIPLTYDLAATTGLRVRGHGGDDQASFEA
ncbi:MAG: hypothetical protein MUE50_10045, partial [Pirellulaceae bacterium]|nr:hypothetical protein [Pirellulaceae bacterium]